MSDGYAQYVDDYQRDGRFPASMQNDDVKTAGVIVAVAVLLLIGASGFYRKFL